VEAAALQATAIDLATARLGRTDPTVLRRRIDRGDSLRFAGDDRGPAELWDVVADALACADHTEATRAAGVLCSLGPSTQSGRVDRPIAELVEACFPRCTDATVLARASAQASLFYSMVDYERSRHHFGVALHQARRTADDATLAYVLGFAYTALTDPDDWDLRHRLATELFVLAERRDDDIDRMEALHLLFSTQLQRGDPLLRTSQAALARLAQDAGDTTRRWMSEYLHAALLHLDGRFDRSIDAAERCRVMAPVSASRAMATYLVQFIATRFAQGRAAELADTLRAVAQDQPLMLAWRAIEAWPAAARGDRAAVEAACVATDDGRALPRDMGWMGGTFLLARAVAAIGDLARAAPLRAALAPYGDRMTWVGHCTFGPVDLALGELALALGDHDAARHHLACARDLCARLHAPAFARDLDLLDARIGT
jgi:tetratricopeptide (TPR) repeat protein